MNYKLLHFFSTYLHTSQYLAIYREAALSCHVLLFLILLCFPVGSAGRSTPRTSPLRGKGLQSRVNVREGEALLLTLGTSPGARVEGLGTSDFSNPSSTVVARWDPNGRGNRERNGTGWLVLGLGWC